MIEKSYRPAPFIPTVARTGGEGASLFRAANFILKGQPPFLYAESYSGSLDLSETIPTATLSGTLALTNSSQTVNGTATSFLTEMRIGQWVFAGNHLLVVDHIIDQTTFIAARAPDETISGLTGYLMPVLFDVNGQRGTAIRGNVRKFDKGNFLGVGDGTFRLNGQALTSSLTLSRRPKLAVYDPSLGTYSIYTLGMNTPTGVTVSEVSGGTKNMQAGHYSIVLVPARTATNGYNNPSEPAEFDITVAGNMPLVSAPAMDTVNGSDAWDVYGTQFTDQRQGVNGPWHFVERKTSADLGTTGATTFTVEWRDAEMNNNRLLTFNNDAPVDSEFIGLLAGFPVFISCQGQGYSSGVKATSPGPMIVPSKPNNIEAAPLDDNKAVTSPPETILGFCEALARLYLLTPAHLQFAQLTGFEFAPVSARSFWKSGFKNPCQLIFVNGTLYGYPVSGPTRSISDAENAVEEHSFAKDIWEIRKDWIPNHVLVERDPKNNAVCFFHAGDSLNDSGYWTTKVMMFMLDLQAWSPNPIILSSDSHDMIVSGVAVVGEHLEFLSGGRDGLGGVEVNTYRFDGGASETITGYLAWQFSDDNEEQRPKVVKAARVTGRLQNSTLGIHGYGADEEIDIDLLETSNAGSKSGSITLENSTEVLRSRRYKMHVKNLQGYTPRIDFSWDGSGDPIRIDEVVLEVMTQGARN